jgi:hypothetical protein
VRIEVRGVKGLSCLDVTKNVEEALGGQVEAREITPEADAAAQEHIQERQWQRGE